MMSHRKIGRRALHGARGLKRLVFKHIGSEPLSRPSRGAWIETDWVESAAIEAEVAPFTGRVD